MNTMNNNNSYSNNENVSENNDVGIQATTNNTTGNRMRKNRAKQKWGKGEDFFFSMLSYE